MFILKVAPLNKLTASVSERSGSHCYRLHIAAALLLSLTVAVRHGVLRRDCRLQTRDNGNIEIQTTKDRPCRGNAFCRNLHG